MARENRLEVKCGEGCKRVQVPTDEELSALKAMRGIKEEARSLKARMQTLQEGADTLGERMRLQERIEWLKAEWDGWEEKRKAEARRRMILLGHEEPDPGEMV